MNDLAGTRILVVGGSSGIGLATAAGALASGAKVTIAARSPERLASAADRLGGDAITLMMDTARESSVETALRAAGTWDHVVFCGPSIPAAPVRSLSTDQAKALIEAKLWGAYRVAVMADIRPRGSLTFVSGALGARPVVGRVMTSMGNAALEALARALALEFSPTRVNAVSPGLVETPLFDQMEPQARDAFFRETVERLPTRFLAQAENVASLVLACITNPALSGSVLRVDGGHALV